MHSFFAGYKDWIRSRLPEGETNPARLLVLISLKRWGQVTMGTLAARLARPKSNVTLLIDELEGEGLVVRRAHPSDRRATYVELTVAGRRIATEDGARYDREIARLFDTLPSDERTQLLATVRRLTAFLRENATDHDRADG
jgi:DNA-binding MarR family transcriptional regulator